VDSWPLWAQIGAVFLLLLCSAFFSISETSMMALNRHRLKHLANSGQRAAKNTQRLLDQTDSLLSVILIGNNLINTALPVLTTGIAIHYFGDNGTVLSLATAGVAFLIIIFCEITPKVIGASYPESIALPASYLISPLMAIGKPLISMVNKLVSFLIKLLNLNTSQNNTQRLSSEELRTIVLESTGHFIDPKHRSILINLFELEHISVDDVMIPRSRMEVLNIAHSMPTILNDLKTCYHNKLPVINSDLDSVIGILSVRKVLTRFGEDIQTLHHNDLIELLTPPYFVPSGTPALQQLQFFQDNQERIGIIVNEYGEILGLLTLEDILEELIGEFTTSTPGQHLNSAWDEDGFYIADGRNTVRDINRKLGIKLPTDGPKTLNGLLLEYLRKIPVAPVCVVINKHRMEISHIEAATIRTVRILSNKTLEEIPQ
jgi:Mg2+/Co2+ transporter CorB